MAVASPFAVLIFLWGQGERSPHPSSSVDKDLQDDKYCLCAPLACCGQTNARKSPRAVTREGSEQLLPVHTQHTSTLCYPTAPCRMERGPSQDSPYTSASLLRGSGSALGFVVPECFKKFLKLEKDTFIGVWKLAFLALPLTARGVDLRRPGPSKHGLLIPR